MKKILLPLFAAAMLFAACDNEQDVALELTQQKGVTFTVRDFQNANGTRMAVDINERGADFTWTEGDTLGVFPLNGYQTAFPISGGMGTNTAVFDGADWALRPSAQYAAYYPFQRSLDFGKEKISVSYLGQTQDGNGSTAHIGDYDFLASVFYTVSDNGNVNFILNHLGCLVRFQITMPRADTYTSMTVSCDGIEGITDGQYDLTAPTPALSAVRTSSEITLGLQNVQTTAPGQDLILYMMLPPMDLSDKQIHIKVAGEKDYETTVTGVDMQAGSIYACIGEMLQIHEYVDLGLSVMWATCNVGADSPEEYGDYLAWGETKAKESYLWQNYLYDFGSTITGWGSCGKADKDPLVSYVAPNYKSIAVTKFDVAHVTWRGEWMMPTKAQIEELINENNTTSEWTTENGVNGLKITSKVNGNAIFLPAVGYKNFSAVSDSTTTGTYWSATPAENADLAYDLLISSTKVGWGDKYRCRGRAVRPVCPSADFISVTSIQITGSNTQLTTSNKLQLRATVAPSDAANATIVWASSDESVATVSADGLVTAYKVGTATITATATDGSGVKGEYQITVAAPTYEYVDLGLSVMWAAYNIGATKPEEFGDYFAWGETEPYYTVGHATDNPCENWKDGKTGYDWSNYKWCDGTDKTMTKYCTSTDYGTVDNKTVLDPEDDAATQNWGGSWRMPTDVEQTELLRCCTWTCTTKNGVNGYNVVGPNGNSIFLPIAGVRSGAKLYETEIYYWSNLVSTYRLDYAAFMSVFPTGRGIWNNCRCYGCPIRPVCANPDFISVASIQITGQKTELAPSETLQLSITFAPSDATNTTVSWSSSNSSIATVSADGLVTAVATGSVTISARAYDGSGVKGTYQITVVAPTLMNGHEYVDLGLSVKWATCNVGATKPEEYGDYFAWGETEPYYTEGHSQDSPCTNWKSDKSGYNWASYQWCNGSLDTQNKYCTSTDFGIVDNKTILEAADDAATANWGGSWRMPNTDERDELLNKCTWTWTTKNGVNGYNVVGPNGKSIFLPAAGYRTESSLSRVGSEGSYLTSSLSSKYSRNANAFGFESDDYSVYGNYRCLGYSVRPVCQ